MCFLNTTGSKETTAKTNKRNIDFHENIAVGLVRVCKVVPAWIYKQLGGATPLNLKVKSLAS